MQKILSEELIDDSFYFVYLFAKEKMGMYSYTCLWSRKKNGVTGFALCCFKTYLIDRKFKVIVNDEESEIKSITYGV